MDMAELPSPDVWFNRTAGPWFVQLRSRLEEAIKQDAERLAAIRKLAQRLMAVTNVSRYGMDQHIALSRGANPDKPRAHDKVTMTV